MKRCAWILLLWLAEAASAATPLCRAEVILEPAQALVGQPVLHRVRIEQQRDVLDLRWETSLSFPAFRVESLLGPAGPPEQSATTQTSEDRRVLFPARAGRLQLPPARIVCESAERIETAEVPGSELLALEPPLEGRPAGWAGLIGPVEVSAYATPDRVALGEAVSLSVTLRGETNVWAAPIRLAGVFAPEVAELFERPPELARDRGRTLVLRSYRSFDVVPRRVGTLEIPALIVPYFDPASGRYEETRTAPLQIEVSERSASGTAEAAETAPPEASRGRARGGLVATAVALALGGAAGLWFRRRARSRAPTAAQRPSRAERADAAAALRIALERGDAVAAAAAASRVLRLGLELAVPGARSLAIEELAGRAPQRAEPALALLTRLEGARYANGDPAALLALAREAAALAR